MNVQHALREASEALDWADWRAHWDHVRALIAPLPRILQHGDLAMTNIAIADGEVVFFDWEDFGLVDVIGFDLAVVLFSLNDFDTVRLRARLAAPTAEAALVRRGCARLNLLTNLFLELFPLYLSLFKVKRSWATSCRLGARHRRSARLAQRRTRAHYGRITCKREPMPTRPRHAHGWQEVIG